MTKRIVEVGKQHVCFFVFVFVFVLFRVVVYSFVLKYDSFKGMNLMLYIEKEEE